MKILKTLVVVAMILGARSAQAQEDQRLQSTHQGYVFGNLGRGGFAGLDDEAPAFGGWMVGAGAGYDFGGGWFVEGMADRLINYTSATSDDSGDVTAIVGRIGHRWGQRRSVFRPYVSFAIGTARDSWTTSYGSKVDAAGMVLGATFGGDIRANASGRLFIRPEVSVMGGMGEAFGRATVGIGYRF